MLRTKVDTSLGTFRTAPKPILQSGLIRSHKIVINGRRPSMALPSRRTPMQASGRPTVGVYPPLCFDRPLWGFAVSGVRTDDSLRLSSGPCRDSR